VNGKVYAIAVVHAERARDVVLERLMRRQGGCLKKKRAVSRIFMDIPYQEQRA
jgi:hypothetical protein